MVTGLRSYSSSPLSWSLEVSNKEGNISAHSSTGVCKGHTGPIFRAKLIVIYNYKFYGFLRAGVRDA